MPDRSRTRILTRVLAAAGLVGIGVGATLALSATGAPRAKAATHAGFRSTDLKKGSAELQRIARLVDPAVVDIDSVLATPSGPTNVAGTGMILTTTGEIVTNNHVVEGSTMIRVAVPGHRRRYLARFVGADPADDIAVIELRHARRLPMLRLTGAKSPAHGEKVVAIGNSLGVGGPPSLSAGEVIGTGRSIVATSETGTDAEHLEGLVESSATLAPGDSGGPLVDTAGRVVGMNTASSPVAASIDAPAGFAIPAAEIDAVAARIESLKAGDGIVVGKQAYLGIEGRTLRPHESGALATGSVQITQMEPDTPAALIRLEPGDLITAINGHPTTSMAVLARLIDSSRPGDRVTVALDVDGSRQVRSTHLVAGPAP